MLVRSRECEHRLVERTLEPRDMFALFRAVVPETTPDTFLFESPSGTSLLMPNAALRLECRGEAVTVEALSENGESLLRALATSCSDHLVESGPGKIELRFERIHSADARDLLLAAAPLYAIRSVLEAARPAGGGSFAAAALGIISFEYATLNEEVEDNLEDPVGFPDFLFWVPEALIVIEPGAEPRALCMAFGDVDPERSRQNYDGAVRRLADIADTCKRPLAPAVSTQTPKDLAEPAVDLDDEAFGDIVRQLKEEIAAGEVYQVVPSRTFTMPCTDALAAFAALRELEPASYRFFVTAEQCTVFGASPETSVRTSTDSGRKFVEVRPIAGTRPRGRTPDEDDRLETELRLDEKEVAEHMMLVDLARNDVGRISVPGTRHASKLMTVERYSRVMHLVSSITGQISNGLDCFDALAACLNAGTLTGAPKLRATQLLRKVEQTRRGPYGGAIGWMNAAGAMDTAVIIRSALVRDGMAYVRAGAGVVHDSDPRLEALETRSKAAALLSVLSADGTVVRP